jgi:E3 ubiquitin-protein ligase UBR4
VLRLLTGLAHSHVTTQLALAADSIPLFHHLEQISSDEHVGSLAENLLEAMRGHPQVIHNFIRFLFSLFCDT